MLTTAQPTKPKRRWYQYSLKTLLIVTTLLCLAFAWIGWRTRQARENRERVAVVKKAVTAIEKLGAKVTFEYQERRSPTWLEELFDDPGDGNDPVVVLEVTAVEFVAEGVIAKVTDEGLEHLTALTELNRLTVWGAGVTDAHVESLTALTELNRLIIIQTSVTDAGLEKLKRLTKLEYLELSGSDVTDGGLVHLKGMTKLRFLGLGSTKVTDEGLKHLSGLTNLRELRLHNSGVTEEGAETFQQVLPKCEIGINRLRLPSLHAPPSRHPPEAPRPYSGGV